MTLVSPLFINDSWLDMIELATTRKAIFWTCLEQCASSSHTHPASMMVTPTGICVQLLQLSIYAAMYVLVHHKSKKGRTCSTELICVFLQIHSYDIRQFLSRPFQKVWIWFCNLWLSLYPPKSRNKEGPDLSHPEWLNNSIHLSLLKKLCLFHNLIWWVWSP